MNKRRYSWSTGASHQSRRWQTEKVVQVASGKIFCNLLKQLNLQNTIYFRKRETKQLFGKPFCSFENFSILFRVLSVAEISNIRTEICVRISCHHPSLHVWKAFLNEDRGNNLICFNLCYFKMFVTCLDVTPLFTDCTQQLQPISNYRWIDPK